MTIAVRGKMTAQGRTVRTQTQGNDRHQSHSTSSNTRNTPLHSRSRRPHNNNRNRNNKNSKNHNRKLRRCQARQASSRASSQARAGPSTNWACGLVDPPLEVLGIPQPPGDHEHTQEEGHGQQQCQ
eukprot:comp23203_c0_seq1/m.37696 comp23203_c0_seq1/g.37696  ORF comp23203_c0_seq1/g.37696 comp23203_c0_seq1/m.37696 type:complete len:126 (+) comp23203_c0_seq1:385-762(+)